MTLYQRIQDTVTFLQGRVNNAPKVAIILGSGLGGFRNIVENDIVIPYGEIPNFPVSTVHGHKGELIFGNIGTVPVMLMAGRFHYYEGYSMDIITFPIRVMKALGVETLILSNAAGGMNKSFRVGDLMIINDHINLFPEHPLRGPNDDRLGTRFPDMSEPYDKELITLAKEIASELSIEVKEGVYVGLQGPTFETPAEYKWLHVIGGDAVGMSTVPENIVARHGNMKVFAMSIITDLGISDTPVKITHEEVLEAANAAEPKMTAIVDKLVRRLG